MKVPGLDVPPPIPPGAAGAAGAARGAGPLGYARPGTGVSTPLFDVQTFFTHLTCWTVALVLFVVTIFFVVPKFSAIFYDFKLDLPAATKLLMTLSRQPVAGFLVALLLITGAGESVAAGFWHRRSTPGVRRAYRLAVVFVVGAITLFVALAIFLPYVALIEGVSGVK